MALLFWERWTYTKKREPMKRLLCLAIFLCFSSVAYAGGGPLGLGVVGEDPSGLTLKYRLADHHALDFRLGLDGFGNDFVLLQGNYLVNVVYLADGYDFKLPLYVGLGASVFFFDFGNEDELLILGRLPIGLDFDFLAANMDVFVELSPQLVLRPDVAGLRRHRHGCRDGSRRARPQSVSQPAVHRPRRTHEARLAHYVAQVRGQFEHGDPPH